MDFVYNVFHVLFAGLWNSVQHHPDVKEKSLKTAKVLKGINGNLLKLKTPKELMLKYLKKLASPLYGRGW